jgi:hypothetical protein
MSCKSVEKESGPDETRTRDLRHASSLYYCVLELRYFAGILRDSLRQLVHPARFRTGPVAVTFRLRSATSIQQKCCILSRVIPQFTGEGLLPSGVHETDLEELKEKMGWSRKRRELLEGLEEALELMVSSGVVRVYLDGSFVTDKDRPNDIDGCYDLAEDVTAEHLGRLAPIFPPNPEGRADAKRRFGVDLFPAAATELGSGQPFLRFFQTDREGRGRGVLSVELQARR